MSAQDLCAAKFFVLLTVLLAAGAGVCAAESSQNRGATAEMAGKSAHGATFSWEDELCANTISYDPKKYDEERLRNTVHLLFGPSDFDRPDYPAPFAPKDIERISLENVEQQCKTALETANRLKFIPLGGIEDYRRAKIAEVKDTCDRDFAEVRGFKDPSALRQYRPAVPECSHFIDALEGKTDLGTAFHESVLQTCARNRSPDQCAQRDFQNAQKPDGVAWMRLQLMTFGWRNCANSIRNAEAQKLEQLRAELEKQFHHRFKVSKKCDEP